MIQALEMVGGGPSVLAHHAVAAGDVPRVLRYAPLAGRRAAADHREAVSFYETALTQVGDDQALHAALLETVSTELYLTDRLQDAIAAREKAVELRSAMERSWRSARDTPQSPDSPCLVRGAPARCRAP